MGKVQAGTAFEKARDCVVSNAIKWSKPLQKLDLSRPLSPRDREMEYGQFYPIAKVTEIPGEKWMILIVRE